MVDMDPQCVSEGSGKDVNQPYLPGPHKRQVFEGNHIPRTERCIEAIVLSGKQSHNICVGVGVGVFQ